jgi:hypothetical protein
MNGNMRRIAIADGDAFGKIERIVESSWREARLLLVSDNYLAGHSLKPIRKINIKDIAVEPWTSPKGKFGGASKEISVAWGVSRSRRT